MIAYAGCILFALIFVLMSAKTNGTLGAKMDGTLAWMHDWAPFSYILVILLLAAPVVSLKIMNSWPKHVEPENPMSKYKSGADVVDDEF